MAPAATSPSGRKPVTIGYWNYRGLGEPLRLLCEYAEQPYEFESWDSCADCDTWIEKKQTALPGFANLPYLKMEDMPFLVQSNAIMRHLGRLNDLLGKTPEEEARMDMVADQVKDLRDDFGKLCYYSGTGDAFVAAAKEFQADGLQIHLTKLSALLGDRKFFGGETPLYADFLAYEVLKWPTYMIRNVLDSFPNLQSFIDGFEKLPKIEEYRKSDRYKEFPIGAEQGEWGNSKSHGFIEV